MTKKTVSPKFQNFKSKVVRQIVQSYNILYLSKFKIPTTPQVARVQIFSTNSFGVFHVLHPSVLSYKEAFRNTGQVSEPEVLMIQSNPEKALVVIVSPLLTTSIIIP